MDETSPILKQSNDAKRESEEKLLAGVRDDPRVLEPIKTWEPKIPHIEKERKAALAALDKVYQYGDDLNSNDRRTISQIEQLLSGMSQTQVAREAISNWRGMTFSDLVHPNRPGELDPNYVAERRGELCDALQRLDGLSTALRRAIENCNEIIKNTEARLAEQLASGNPSTPVVLGSAKKAAPKPPTVQMSSPQSHRTFSRSR